MPSTDVITNLIFTGKLRIPENSSKYVIHFVVTLVIANSVAFCAYGVVLSVLVFQFFMLSFTQNKFQASNCITIFMILN